MILDRIIVGLLAFALAFFPLLVAQAQAQSAQVRRLLLTPQQPAPVAAGGCSQATTFLARTSGLDATHQNAYITMICGMVTDGTWTKFDILYITATADATTAGLNLVSTSFTLTNTSATFTADTGYAGNGTTAYLDTGYNPSTNGVNFTQNSAALLAWSTKSADDNANVLGQLAGFFTNALVAKNFGGTAQCIVNQGSDPGGTPTNGFGLFNCVRSSNSTVTNYYNGTSLATTAASTSGAAISSDITLLRDTSNFFGGGIASAGASSSLSAGDVANVYSRIHTFLHTVNAATFP